MSRPSLLILRPLVLAIAIPVAAAACIALLGARRAPPRDVPGASPVAPEPPDRAAGGLTSGDAPSRGLRAARARVAPEGVAPDR